ARGVTVPVTGGIGAGIAFGLHPQQHLGAEAAAMLAAAPRIRTELMMLEEKGEAGLGHFDAAELRAARRNPFAPSIPAITGRECSGAGPGVEHVPDELLAGARIAPFQCDAIAAAPSGDGALRARLGERRRNRLDDFGSGMARTHGDGCS